MPDLPTLAFPTGTSLTFRRSGFASILFALFRPADAKAAKVNRTALMLTLASRFIEIPLQEIEKVEMQNSWRWRNVRLRRASGEAVVSGLSPSDAKALAEALETAMLLWWREALSMLRPVHDRLAQFANPSSYTSRAVLSDLRRDAKSAVGRFPSRWPDVLSSSAEFHMLERILAFLKDPDHLRDRANETFVADELKHLRKFFDRIEARPLTGEQRRAVVVDEGRNLVVAAAGSGKTSVIVAKTGWLLHRGHRRPSELLLLAFARDARKEMEERIRRRLGEEAARGIAVRTFHSLGMAIVGDAEGRRPTLAKVAEDDRALFGLLKRIVADLLADREISPILLNWFQDRFAPYKSEHEFRSWGEYWEYIRRHEIRSLKGEKVKSFEECEIANFLYLNGVPYKYECAYEHDTATHEKRQYQPDFYLPEAGIYIEHFALDATGDTPSFIDRDEYLRSMDWKRQLHAKYGTTLIETYSHQCAAGKLPETLAAALGAHGVTLSPIAPDKVFTVLEQQGRVDPFMQLVAIFLGHYKGSRLSIEEITRRAAMASDPPRAKAFVSVFRPIFERYQKTLHGMGQIDFHDMINKAADHVASGRYRSPFGYILVDEFQDISPGRARLLKALLGQSPSVQLFAVGDDWQAIFRFAGADIAIMREFEERFGDSERVDLETTFRCSDRIAAVATQFILSNPAQIPKKVRSTCQANGPSVHIGLSGTGPSLLREALAEVAADAARHDGISTVLLLGRYRHVRPRNMSTLAKQYPGLRLSYMTVHSSKGLEADYVVVLGLCAGKYGFPSEVADDPLLDLVLASPEGHPNAEERRLFYVAITRAKRHVFLLAGSDPPSPFILELIDDGYDVTVFGRLPESDVPCPRCVSKGAWSGAKTPGAEAPSTAARIGPIATTDDPPVPLAARDCRSRQRKPSVAATAIRPLKAVPDATVGCNPRTADTARSWGARTGPFVVTPEIPNGCDLETRLLPRLPVSGGERAGPLVSAGDGCVRRAASWGAGMSVRLPNRPHEASVDTVLAQC